MAAHQGSDDHTPLSQILSGREYEVFMKLAEGASPGQIAQDCSLSVSTVYTYRTRILQKTRLHSDAEIIRYALKHHLIE